MNTGTAFVIAIDGLRASSLGCYGNSAIETAAFDRLAASGVTHDLCFVPSGDLKDVYASLWDAGARPDLLISDAAPVAELATTNGILAACVEPLSMDQATQFNETACAALLDEAASRLESQPCPGLVWIHHRGFFGAWDAPHEVACSLTEEGDPEIPPGSAVPDITVPGDDIDEVVFIESCRYFAQLIAIDAALEGFLEWLLTSDVYKDSSITVVGTRGFSLGEHGYVGGDVTRSYSESFHVPCIRFRAGYPPRRVDNLQWLANAVDASKSQGEHLIWRLANQCGIRTAEFHAVFAEDNDLGELFVKPDDRWEANNIATLCREELEQLATLVGRAGRA